MTEQIVCIGAGYVGGPSMAVMADQCPGINIKVVDIDQKRIDRWNNLDNSDLPVYEPGLEEVLTRVRGKNLTFTTDLEREIGRADMVFLSVNTPTKNYGYGAGQAADLSYIESAARQIAEYGKGQTIVVERSTLPVRTAEALQTILKQGNGDQYKILSNPEFMAEGTAIADLQNPDRVLVGGQCSESVEELASIYKNWVPNNRILRTNVWSAELSKLTANAFLAQRISSINSIAALCEKSGANITEVKQAIGADTRIGSSFLNPGPGFGGSCFKKDILNLAYLADHFGLMEVANYWRSVLELNEWTQHRMAQIVSQKFYGTLRGKKIAVLGFSFKANTNDTRESPAIELCSKLIQEGADLCIHDPKVTESEIKRELRKNESHRSVGSYQYEQELNSAVEDAHAVVVMTDWDEYRRLDWATIANKMQRPAWVFDTRGITNLREAAANGLETWEVGCGDHQ